MSPEDHKLTASFGRKPEAEVYREKQEFLISQGLFKEAQQMNIDDIHSRFGNKYDKAIQQMKEYTNQLFGYSIWP